MPIRLALIGCGRISRRHVLAMKDLQERGRGDFVVSAVCDANGQAASERADMLRSYWGSALSSTARIRSFSQKHR